MNISPNTFFLNFVNTRKKAGFTFTELMVILVIISFLMLIVMTSISKSRSSARDSQVRADKQTIKLALARAAQFNPGGGGKYPGTPNTWYCLKTTGTNCYNTLATMNTAVNTILLPYFPGSVYPVPPGTKAGENRHDAYIYNPNWAKSSDPLGVGGPILVWPSEKVITSQSPECNGYVLFQSGGSGGSNSGVDVYYCYERLQ